MFTVALANGLFLVVGSVILVYVADLHMPSLFEGSFFLNVVLLLLLLVAAPAHDARRRDIEHANRHRSVAGLQARSVDDRPVGARRGDVPTVLGSTTGSTPHGAPRARARQPDATDSGTPAWRADRVGH